MQLYRKNKEILDTSSNNTERTHTKNSNKNNEFVVFENYDMEYMNEIKCNKISEYDNCS